MANRELLVQTTTPRRLAFQTLATSASTCLTRETDHHSSSSKLLHFRNCADDSLVLPCMQISSVWKRAARSVGQVHRAAHVASHDRPIHYSLMNVPSHTTTPLEASAFGNKVHMKHTQQSKRAARSSKPACGSTRLLPTTTYQPPFQECTLATNPASAVRHAHGPGMQAQRAHAGRASGSPDAVITFTNVPVCLQYYRGLSVATLSQVAVDGVQYEDGKHRSITSTVTSGPGCFRYHLLSGSACGESLEDTLL